MAGNRIIKEKKGHIVSYLVPALAVAVIFCLMFYGILQVAQANDRAQADALRTTINRDVLHCYASEGKYPPDLDYISEKYGFSYDSNKYKIEYVLQEDNSLPAVTVTEVER